MSINLLPWRDSLRARRKKRLAIEAVVAFSIALLLILVGHFKLQAVLSDQNSNIAHLEQEINKTSKDYLSAISLQKKLNEAKWKEAFLKSKLDFNHESLKIIEKISNTIPDAIYLTEISRKENKLHFIGKSYSHAELAEFLENVKSKVEKQPIMTETAHGDSNEIDFDVEYEV